MDELIRQVSDNKYGHQMSWLSVLYGTLSIYSSLNMLELTMTSSEGITAVVLISCIMLNLLTILFLDQGTAYIMANDCDKIFSYENTYERIAIKMFS